jgi:hypothetical protein
LVSLSFRIELELEGDGRWIVSGKGATGRGPAASGLA